LARYFGAKFFEKKAPTYDKVELTKTKLTKERAKVILT